MPRSPDSVGLPALRRSGAVTELQFLYECLTQEPTQLRPIAERMGLTVQAASHSYRQLSRAGLVEVRDGHYRPTVRGIEQLHAALDHLAEDVASRLDRLHVIRATRAVAGERLRTGERVSLELRDGILTARRGGSGASRGTVAAGARAGALVEIGDLEGIVPIVPATVSVYPLGPEEIADPRLPDRLRALARGINGGQLAAVGLEAVHAVRSATPRPIVRFAVAESCRAASRVGVPTTVVVARDALPQLLAAFSEPEPPPLQVTPLPGGGRRRAP